MMTLGIMNSKLAAMTMFHGVLVMALMPLAEKFIRPSHQAQSQRVSSRLTMCCSRTVRAPGTGLST